MRTIKFRGKDIETGKWVYGFYLRLEDTFRKPIEGKERITNRIYTGSADSCVDQTTGYDFSGDWYEVDPDTVGQFTGFLDFHRKEIYEGDIIQRYYNIGDGKIYKFEGVVVFEDGTFGVKQGDSILHLHSVKGWSIIGNIFDNPELLKGGEK